MLKDTLALPIIFGLAVNQINQLIDKNSSFISIKGISVLTYAVKLNEFVWGIMVVSIVTSSVSYLGSKFAIESISKFKIQVAKTISTILYLVIPSCTGILIFKGNCNIYILKEENLMKMMLY